MRTSLGTYDLLDRSTGAPIACELYEGITEGNLRSIETEWQPAFRALKAADTNVEDAHWEWRRKHVVMKDKLNYRGFVVENRGHTEAIMIVELVSHVARISEQAGKHLVYVEFLATAPWNRLNHDPPRLKGLGRLLISTAINVSFDEEFEGRVGLHALPGSESFYREGIQMNDLGPDADYPQNLVYFEMSQKQAARYFSPVN